ncbi:hypothetical protein JL722_9765 [Aureococcus anophagefferens]|nr:hypothetical protein JL722_9765 [Aureococcus anophagefferens]
MLAAAPVRLWLFDKSAVPTRCYGELAVAGAPHYVVVDAPLFFADVISCIDKNFSSLAAEAYRPGNGTGASRLRRWRSAAANLKKKNLTIPQCTLGINGDGRQFQFHVDDITSAARCVFACGPGAKALAQRLSRFHGGVVRTILVDEGAVLIMPAYVMTKNPGNVDGHFAQAYDGDAARTTSCIRPRRVRRVPPRRRRPLFEHGVFDVADASGAKAYDQVAGEIACSSSRKRSDAERAAKLAAKLADRAAEKAARDAEWAAKLADRAAEKAALLAMWAAEDAAHAAAADRATKDAMWVAEKAARDAAEKAKRDAARPAEQAASGRAVARLIDGSAEPAAAPVAEPAVGLPRPYVDRRTAPWRAAPRRGAAAAPAAEPAAGLPRPYARARRGAGRRPPRPYVAAPRRAAVRFDGSEESAAQVLADCNATRACAPRRPRRAAPRVRAQSSEDLFAPGGIFYAGP